MLHSVHRAIYALVPSCLLAVGCSSTIRAREIQLVDENGEEKMSLTATKTGAVIACEGSDSDKDDATLNIGVLKAGADHQGPTTVFIQAESGKSGRMMISVDPSGAHLYMGSDSMDGFQITSDKDGLTIALDPKEGLGAGLKPDESPILPFVPKTRGVRITLDKGRIVVHDLAGHEVAVVPDPAPKMLR